MSNYRFKKEHERNSIIINELSVVVTADNLTDKYAEVILGMAGVAHNIEIIPGRELDVLNKKKELATGEVALPSAIALALKEAKIDETISSETPKEKVSNSSTSAELTANKKRGRKAKS